jgi:hypothetical protein
MLRKYQQVAFVLCNLVFMPTILNNRILDCQVLTIGTFMLLKARNFLKPLANSAALMHNLGYINLLK